MDISNKQRAAAAAVAAVLAVVVSGVLVLGGTDNPKVDPGQRGSGQGSFAAAKHATDLLTEPVPPGAAVVTGVNLAPGAAISGPVVLAGGAVGCFSVTLVTSTDNGSDGVWVEVRATSTCKQAIRFTAYLGYE